MCLGPVIVDCFADVRTHRIDTLVPDTGTRACDVNTHTSYDDPAYDSLKKFTYISKVSSYLKKSDVHELVQFAGRIPRIMGFVVGYMACMQGKRIA